MKYINHVPEGDGFTHLPVCGKAAALRASGHAAELAEPPKSYSGLPEDKALLVVVENGPFDAVAYPDEEREFNRIFYRKVPDPRPTTLFLMDRTLAETLAAKVFGQ